jgi:hypothetical protein
MAINNGIERLKKVIAGIRSDADPTTADGDQIAIRVNQYGELIISTSGSSGGSVAVAGDVAHDAVDSGNPVKIGFRARDTLITAVVEDDRTDGVADVYGRQYTHSASHDTLSVTDNVTLGNGPETQHQGGTLADITNAVAGPTYYYIDMSGYNHLSLQFEISSGSPTLTVEGTLEDNGTAADSCVYQDIGSATFGAASWTTDSILVDDSGKCGGYHFIRVAVAGSGTEDLEIFYKKWYA